MVKLFRVAVAVPISLSMAVALAGCGNPLKSLGDKATEKAVSQIVETTTDGAVTTGIGGSASLPPNWPDIPTPSAGPVMSIGTEDGFLVSFPSSEEEMEGILAQLRQMGYKDEMTMDYGDAGKMVVLVGSEWSVAIMYGQLDDDDYHASYTVSPVGE